MEATLHRKGLGKPKTVIFPTFLVCFKFSQMSHDFQHFNSDNETHWLSLQTLAHN